MPRLAESFPGGSNYLPGPLCSTISSSFAVPKAWFLGRGVNKFSNSLTKSWRSPKAGCAFARILRDL